MIVVLLAIVEIASLGVVIWHALCALNHMSRATRPSIIAAVVFVFAGAACQLFLLLIGEARPGIVEAAFNAGIAVGMLANKRRDVRCPCVLSFLCRSDNDKEIPA